MLSSSQYPRLLSLDPNLYIKENGFQIDVTNSILSEGYSFILENGAKTFVPNNIKVKVRRKDYTNTFLPIDELTLNDLVQIPFCPLIYNTSFAPNYWKDFLEAQTYEERRVLAMSFENSLFLLRNFNPKHKDYFDEFIYLNKNKNFSRSSYSFLSQLQLIYKHLYPDKTLCIKEKTNGYYFSEERSSYKSLTDKNIYEIPIIKIEKYKRKKRFIQYPLTVAFTNQGIFIS